MTPKLVKVLTGQAYLFVSGDLEDWVVCCSSTKKGLFGLFLKFGCFCFMSSGAPLICKLLFPFFALIFGHVVPFVLPMLPWRAMLMAVFTTFAEPKYYFGEQ